VHAGELEDRGWTVVLDVLPLDLDERAGRRRARAWLLGAYRYGSTTKYGCIE
jgi:hypothetical protein